MKILYTFRSLAVMGGIERVLVEKMNNLVSMYGYEVYMLTTDQGSHPIPYRLSEKVHIEDLEILFHKQYNYSAFRRLWDGWKRTQLFEIRLSEKILKIRPDVIVCTTADPVYSIVKVKGVIPLIVESHSICSRTLGEKSLRQRYVAWLLKEGLKRTDKLVALTENDAKDWRQFCRHIAVIPDIIHLNEGDVSSLKNKRVIWVGRFDYQKRPLEIVEIWKLLYPKFPDWHLDIYGDGIQREELEILAYSLNINIQIHQPTKCIFDVYRESSILVSTSLYEPFGLVIPEAMSCGLPVVSYDCPFGPASIIEDGKTGFLIGMNDKKEFAEKLCSLMNSFALRCLMGRNGRFASAKYDADKLMPLWKSLFKEMVK